MGTTDATEILDCLLAKRGQGLSNYDALDAWWADCSALGSEWPEAIDWAIAGGFVADRVGYAFSAGYQGALRRLCPELPRDVIASLCVTEEGGGHPKRIQTRLEADGDGFRLTGEKRWATLSQESGVFLIAAVEGQDESGRNRLRVVRVAGPAEGLRTEPMPPTPFAPEISHCQVSLDGVRVTAADLLPGDGYANYVKPFRTIEDTFVTIAVLGYLWREGLRLDWPKPIRERVFAQIVAYRALADADPSSGAIHVALGGLGRNQGALLADVAELWSSDPAAGERWQRDCGLFAIAGKARAQRLESAWLRAGG